MLDVLFESQLSSLPLLARGKVRDIYAVGDEHLLIVTTDRLSAFDVVLPDPIPGKGAGQVRKDLRVGGPAADGRCGSRCLTA